MTTVEAGLEKLNGAAREAVVQQAVGAIQRDVMLTHLSVLPPAKLTAWCTEAESGLQMWVAGQDSAIVDRIYYELGRAGAASGVPIQELLRGLVLVLNLGRKQSCMMPPSSTGASDPLAAFCDYAKYYLIRGYEDALR